MSQYNTMTKELARMGFGRNHIQRAFNIYQKNHPNDANDPNVSSLTELIIRLQRKDSYTKKRHSEPYTQANMIHHFLPPLPIPGSNIKESNSRQLKPKQRHNPLRIPHKRHSEITSSLPAKTRKLLHDKKQYKERAKRRAKYNYKKHIKRFNHEATQTVIIHDHDVIPTISDDINELFTPPLPLLSSNKRMNGREFKRIMASDARLSDSSSASIRLRYSSRDRMSSDDTEKKARRGLQISLDEYSLSSPPTHNSDCQDVDDTMNDDVFQQQSQRILLQNRSMKRYSLQAVKRSTNHRYIPKRKSDSMRPYNTLDVPLFKELESTFSLLKSPTTKIQKNVPQRRSIRIQKARNGKIKAFVPKAHTRKRRQSDPTAKGVWKNNFACKHMQHIKKRCAVMDDEQIIDKIIGTKEYKLWDLNNRRVDLYRAQSTRVHYEECVPSLYDVMYPTALSSISLPAAVCGIENKYKVTVFLDVETFTNIKVETTETYKNKTRFTFDLNTTTQDMIDGLLDNIKSDLHIHKTMLIEWDTLYSMCFMLKVDGREEFLKYNDNHKITELHYVRECIRNQETKQLQFILIYVSGLLDYCDSEYRADLASKQVSCAQLKYEHMGFNVIFNALQQYEDATKDSNSFGVFTKCVRKEVEWVCNKVGPIKAQQDKQDATKEINYHLLDKEAILLSEFYYPVEIAICNILNITSCPRYKPEHHYFLLLRMELMFGNEVYSECCWDVRIPSEFVNDKIIIPHPECNFVSNAKQLTYAMLPRECVWNITIYGVQKDKKRESEIKIEQKKSEKKKNKNKPKLISRSTPSMVNLDFNIKSSSNNYDYDYERMAISNRNRLVSNAQQIQASHMCNEQIVADHMHAHPHEDEEHRSKYVPQAIAWCRIPLINDKHCLHKGRHIIHLWPIPKHKHAAQATIDPYSTDRHLWKQFGATYPCTTKRNNSGSKPVSLTIQFFFDTVFQDESVESMNTHIKYDSSVDTKSGFKFDIVAPIVNPRRDPNLLSTVQPFAGKDNLKRGNLLSNMVSNDNCDGLLSERDKLLINSNKRKLMRDGYTLYSYLSSVHWKDQVERMESYDYLSKWTVNDDDVADVICLLKHNFADNHIRLYAVSQLHKLDDYTLHKYLFQLIEALKVEIHHSSFLSRFLMHRALSNPNQIGHFVFWYMKAQLFVNAWYYERFALFLEEYLAHLPAYARHNIFKQYELVNKLKIIASQMRDKRRLSSHKSNKLLLKKEAKESLKKQLMLLNTILFNDEQNHIQFPLNPFIKLKQFEVEKCSIVSNKKILLTFVTDAVSRENNTVCAIFKYGDQLTYELLTNNLLSIMDILWLQNNIDLKFKKYEMIQTGSKTGFTQVLNNANNAKKAISKLFKNKKNSQSADISQKRELYTRSLAAYCIATMLLGITLNKKACKNIVQITNNGELFYINFAHLLYKAKQKRNRNRNPPFLFTNGMKSPMNNRVLYQQFQMWMFDAFSTLRKKYQLFYNLLTLSSYAPITQHKMDLAQYARTELKSIFRFDLKNHDKKIKIHIKNSLQSALNHKGRNSKL